MSDLISRQAAIDALKEKVFHNLSDEFYGTMQVLEDLPSAQPTIDTVSKEKYVHALTALQLANEKLAYLRYKPYTEKDGADIIDVWVKQILFEERHKQNAVEVVRCKNCKHWDKVDNIDGVNYGTCERKCTAIRRDAFPNENWFCADGKKKEQNE